MLTILGVDPSLAATGLCRITIDTTTPPHEAGQLADLVQLQTVTVNSAGHKTDLPHERRIRVQAMRRQILRAALGADLVLIETPFYNRMSTQGALVDRSWLWGSLLDGLHVEATPVAHVPIAKVKKIATGKGGGEGTDKTGVAAGLTKLWGDLVTPRGDNEFDALALATIGAIKLARTRLPIRVLERHMEVVAGIDWHELGEQASA